MHVGIVKRPLKGEAHCGDACAHWSDDGIVVLCVVDGLGHGEHAEEAAQAALAYVEDHRWEPLPHIFEGCDRAIWHTRGVAMGIVVVHVASGTVTFAGVNNIRTMVVGKETVRLTSANGIVGGGFRKLSVQTVPFTPNDLIIMYTDGLPENIELSEMGAVKSMEVNRLAEDILEKWGTGTDDSAVLVFRKESR